MIGKDFRLQDIWGSLLKFRQAIDDAQAHFFSHLHLHHLGRQAFTNPMGILHLKLNLSATSFNEVKEQQVRDVLQFIVTRVCAQVQNLGHRSGSSSSQSSGQPHLSPNPLLFHNAPKGGGTLTLQRELPLAYHTGSRLIQPALQWLIR